MGAIFSSRQASRGNRVSSSLGIATDATLESENVEIRIPDATRRHKVKSKSFHLAFTKSFKKSNRSQSPSSSPNIRSERIEIDRLRQEIDNKKSNYDRQVEELKKDRERLQEENTRLRNEVKVLNAALPKLRAGKEKACLAEKDALERATALEQEKDKTQRQFKMYREAKEKEVQSILKQKQKLTTQLRKFVSTDGSVQDFLLEGNDVRQQCQSISEWLLDNQSVTEVYFHEKLSDGMLTDIHPFIDIKTEREIYSELNSLLSSLHHIEYGVPKTNVYSIYITFTDDMVGPMNLFMKGCRKLMIQYEMDERLLTFCRFPWYFQPVEEDYKCACKELFENSDIFVAFIGHDSDGQLYKSIVEEVINFPKQCIFASLEEQSLGEIKINEKKHHLIFGVHNIDAFVSACLTTLTRICKLFFEKQHQQGELEKEHQIEHSYNEVQAKLSSWNILGIEEQHCIQENICKDIHNSISIENEIKSLKSYVLQDGPVQPLLLTGKPGSGKSFLLSHWVTDLSTSLSNVCVLYHVVSAGSPDSRSTCHLLRRFIYDLLDLIPVTSNANQLEKDFPRYLERACSKYSNGVIIVIDGADLLDNIKHLKWLLDPLLFPVRVVISVSSENYPEKWKSWPHLLLNNEYENPLNLFQVKYKHTSYAEKFNSVIKKVFPDGILMRTAEKKNLCNHLFRDLCAILTCDNTSPHEAEERFKECISKNNLTDLYSYIINCLLINYEKLLFQVLYFLLICHNGIHLMEFEELLPSYDFLDVYVILSVLVKYQIVERIYGLYQLKRIQVQDAIRKTFNNLITVEEHNFKNVYIQMFMVRFHADFISYRVADELPWQLAQVGRKEELQTCIASVTIFLQLYRKGRLFSIIDYWGYLGKDVKGVHDVYTKIVYTMEDGEFNKDRLTVLYDMLGEFTLDQGHYRLAHGSFEKSLDLKETHFDPDDPRIGYSILCLGRLFTQWKKFQTAEDYYNQVLEGKDQNGEADTIPYAKCLECLAILYHIQDRTDAVESCRKQASQIRQLYCSEHTAVKMKKVIGELCKSIYMLVEENGVCEELVNHLKHIAVLYFNTHQSKEAIEVFSYTLELLVQVHGKQHPFVAEVMCKLSCVYQVEMDYEKAERHLEEALLIFLKSEAIESAFIQRAWKNLIKLFKKEEKFDEIEGWYRKIVSIQKEVSGDASQSVAKASNALAVHLSKKKKYNEALDCYHESILIYNKHLGFQDRKVAEVICNMAKVFYEQHKRSIAAQMYKISKDRERNLEQYLSILR